MSLQETKVISALIKNQDMPSIMGYNMKALLPTHEDMWEVIWGYYQDHKEVIPQTVFQETFPEFEYIDLDGKTKHYVDAQQENLASIEIEKIIQGAAQAVKKGVKPTTILKHFGKRISEVERTTGASRFIDVRDTDNALSHLEKVRQLAAAHNGQPGIAFGFEYMDEAYPTGMAPGHLIFLMGYSGLGKTWFGIKLMINAWLQGYSPLIINLEMSPEELRERIFFLISEYNMEDLVRANIDPEDFKKWAQDFMEGKAEFNLVGNESYGEFTVDMIQSKIEQFKPDVILLDYMQLFSDRGRNDNEMLRAKKSARELKQLATMTKIPIVVITAVTGKDKKDRINPPDVAQVAFSSEIEYAANLAFAVHTHRNALTQEAIRTEIVFRKNRHGPLCSFDVKIDFEKGTIDMIPKEEQSGFIDDLDDDDEGF